MSALKDIRVIDLSRVLAGPACTQILGDLGADIIKIEKPFEGDDTRKWGPPFLKDAHGNDTNESAYYLSANRNKKSVAIDIKHPEGQKLIHDLLAQSDVLIENFKVGGLEKFGLGYEDIQKKHPHIVYCSITGFGQTGPLASEPGYDFIAQAMGGLMASTGAADGEPMKIGVALSDIMTGLYAAIGILSSLHARTHTGKGQMVDLALLDCTLASMTNIAQFYLTSGKLAPRLGNAHSTIVPYQAFETADSHIIVAVGNDTQFQRFCDAIGFQSETRFSTNPQRLAHREELVPQLQGKLKAKTTSQWMEVFLEADVPAGPVNAMDKVFGMEQIAARDMKIEMEHAGSGRKTSLVGSPLKLSETPVNYRLSPPVRGQHTKEILEKILKISPDVLQDLKQRHIIEVAS